MSSVIESAFARPLTFGDPEQVRILNAMNGEGAYCPQCYRDVPVEFTGDICTGCHKATYVYGAAALERVKARQRARHA